MVALIKPYEISVWEDLPEVVNGVKERKIAVIGTEQMTSPNKAFSPVLTEHVNGEVTLSFSIVYKYFDPVSEAEVTNPFISYLINERKVKLHYDNKWYTFLIKTHTEDSDNNVWTYELTDAFVNELSKVGYNIEFNPELNNNQGTITELAQKTLKYTDWQVSEDNDLLVQTVKEPMYICRATHDFNVINTDTNDVVTIRNGDIIYVFYSYFSNRNAQFLQFMRADDESSFIYDDKNTITGTNYRLIDINEQDTPEIMVNEKGIAYGVRIKISGANQQIIVIKGLTSTSTDLTTAEMLPNQGYRKAYKQLTTYDPVAEHLVNIYDINNDAQHRQVYDYETYVYTTSNVIQSFVSNGNNFAVYDSGGVKISGTTKVDDGYVQGWSKFTDTTSEDNHTIGIITKPEVTNSNSLLSLDKLPTVLGYLKLHFGGACTSSNGYKNTFFNSGFTDNISFIDHVNRGEEYVLRIAAGYSTTEDSNIQQLNWTTESGQSSKNNIRALVAKYTTDPNTNRRTIQKDSVIFDFNGYFKPSPIVISNGTFNNDFTAYLIDGVPQVPMKNCVYQSASTGTQTYVWNDMAFVAGSNPTVQYYMTTAAAQRSVSNEELTNPQENFGIFVYLDGNTNYYYYISDIQLTKGYKDTDESYMTIGNVPRTTVITSHNFYLKPAIGTNTNAIETFATKEALASDLGINDNQIVPKYNEDSEKILSITEAQSNCFNILQSLCETFECWMKIDVDCDENGYIRYDNDGKPLKQVSFHKYAGIDNAAGFKYGINLKSIQRNLNSEEIVTKLIVENSQSDYITSGQLSIRDAATNPSGEANILNFDYYLNKGLISNPEQCRADLSEYYKQMKDYNTQLNEKQQERIEKEDALLKLNANVNVYDNLVNQASEDKARALDRFNKLGVGDYDTYAKNDKHQENLMESEEVSSIVADIYDAQNVLNVYYNVNNNTKNEYNKTRLEVEGAKDYNITITVAEVGISQYVTKVTFSDYVHGFKFRLIGNNNATVTYETSINKKVFEINSNSPYTTIIFDGVPSNYEGFASEGITLPSSGGTINLVCHPSDTYKDLYPGLQAQIDAIQAAKDAYEREFYTKYSQYIQEGTWSSTDYVDSELYYFDAVQVSSTSAFPKVEYTIDVAEVSELEGLENYNFKIGDKSYIEDTDFFGWAAYYVNKQDGTWTYIQPSLEHLSEWDVHRTPAREEVIVSQIEWHLDEPENNVITIQNFKTQFEDLFQRISATVQTVQYNEATYAKTASIVDTNGTINQNLLLASLNNITGNEWALTTDGSIKIDKDSILIQNLTNGANLVKIDSRGINISHDGGANWSTAIDGYGINAGLIYTGSLNTNEVVIGDRNDPSFRWDKYGISAYKKNSGNTSDQYDYQTYVRFDQFGLYGIQPRIDGQPRPYAYDTLEEIKDNAQFGLTWDGFFIKNSYAGGGQVSITHDNDFQILKPDGSERLKIGALEWGEGITDPTAQGATTEPTLYGIRIRNDAGKEVMKTDDDGNITIVGTIDALGGNFKEKVTVGKDETDSSKPYIVIDGTTSSIYNTHYQDGAGPGWMINKDGDAVFNNITARGVIKTAVFEYAEIQAVGGVFLFRPSSTIKTVMVDGNDIVVTVEKPALFKTGQWCKISNYIQNGEATDPDIEDISTNNGLCHVYPISNIYEYEGHTYLVLQNAAKMVTDGVLSEEAQELVGGSLVNMGVESTHGDYNDGKNNYGIGVNSSDNTVNLPARAISLFETEIHDTTTYYEPFINEECEVNNDEGSFSYGILDYDNFITNDVLIVTYQGQDYEVNKISREGNKNYYGGYNTDNNTIDLSTIPFLLESEYVDHEDIIENNIEWELVDPSIGELETQLINGDFIDAEQIKITFFNGAWDPIDEYTLTRTNSEDNPAVYLHADTGYQLTSYRNSEGYILNGRTEYVSENGVNLVITIPTEQTFQNRLWIGYHDVVTLQVKKPDKYEADKPKISYKYKGILGTLPTLPDEDVAPFYKEWMEGTQGIYTDNMYIGDAEQHIAFYTYLDEENEKQKALEIVGSNINLTGADMMKIINSDSTGTTIRGDRLSLSNFMIIGESEKDHITVGDISVYELTEDATKIKDAYYAYSHKTGLYTENGTLTNPATLQLYELKEENNYEPTEDNSFQEGKTYYVDFGSDARDPSSRYVAITSGQIQTIDDIKQLIDPTVAHLYEKTRDRNGIGFFANRFDQTAYLTSGKLYIPQTVVLDEMRVGSRGDGTSEDDDTGLWSWKKIDVNENLRLVWLGGYVD